MTSLTSSSSTHVLVFELDQNYVDQDLDFFKLTLQIIVLKISECFNECVKMF